VGVVGIGCGANDRISDVADLPPCRAGIGQVVVLDRFDREITGPAGKQRDQFAAIRPDAGFDARAEIRREDLHIDHPPILRQGRHDDGCRSTDIGTVIVPDLGLRLHACAQDRGLMCTHRLLNEWRRRHGRVDFPRAHG
jgi:hypothetical protein